MCTQKFEGPRGARPEELDALVELLNSVFRPQTKSMAREHGCIYCRRNADCLRVMLANGVPVSHFGIRVWNMSTLGCPHLMASVGGVCTHPDFRGLGLATILLKDAEALFRRKGVPLVLISGGRGLYVTNGYSKAGRCFLFDFDRASATRCAQEPFHIRRYTPADLAAIAWISEREPVRYERPLSELIQLVEGRLARIIPDSIVVVSCAGHDVAWFDVSTGYDGKTRMLWEYAGDRDAVLAGLSRFMRREGIDKVHAPVLAHDADMVGRMKALMVPAQEEAMPEHTVKILDFGLFMDSMRPVFSRHISTDILGGIGFANSGDGGIIRAGNESLHLPNSQEVVKLVFGSVEPVAALAGAGPQIREFVQAALPLPLVWPGINYV